MESFFLVGHPYPSQDLIIIELDPHPSPSHFALKTRTRVFYVNHKRCVKTSYVYSWMIIWPLLIYLRYFVSPVNGTQTRPIREGLQENTLPTFQILHKYTDLLYCILIYSHAYCSELSQSAASYSFSSAQN